jgi:acetyl-CoA carboxylase carboxyltransferase component
LDDTVKKHMEELRKIKEAAITGEKSDSINAQYVEGKLTARERINRLLDDGSFVEWNMLVNYKHSIPGDGVICGYGTIDGRKVCVFAHDWTVMGGSVGPQGGYKMYTTIERAHQMGIPLIGLYDSPGARLPKLESLKAIEQSGTIDILSYQEDRSASTVFYPLSKISGVVPRICAVLGTCAGMGVYSSALFDFIFMVEGLSHMFITGPRIVKSITGEDTSMEMLGGAKVHTSISGLADFRVQSELECLHAIKKLLSYFPVNHRENAPWKETGDVPDRMDSSIVEVLSSDPDQSYDMHQIVNKIVDNGDFLEVKEEFAPEIITGLARLDGYPVGIIANQPLVNFGMLTAKSAAKQAKFIGLCDSFNIPLVLLVDTPSYLPGCQQEYSGTIQNTAKVLYSLCEATVPRISVIVRKSYGGAGNLSMGVNSGLGTDFIFAWPTAEVGRMRAEQLVDLFYSKEIDQAKNPQQMREEMVAMYRKYNDVLSQVSLRTHITDVIEPGETRPRLVEALSLLRNKNSIKTIRTHGNMPMQF